MVDYKMQFLGKKIKLTSEKDINLNVGGKTSVAGRDLDSTMEAPSDEAEIGPETGPNIRSRLWPPYRDITRTLGW